MNDLRKELLGESTGLTTPKITINKKYIVILSTFVILGWYIGTLLFGTNSIIRLTDLQEEVNSLKNTVELLKNDNARLQKELFEIEQIRGEN